MKLAATSKRSFTTAYLVCITELCHLMRVIERLWKETKKVSVHESYDVYTNVKYIYTYIDIYIIIRNLYKCLNNDASSDMFSTHMDQQCCWLYSQISDIWCLWSTHVHLQPHMGSPLSSPSDYLRPKIIKSRWMHRSWIMTDVQSVFKSISVIVG